jgi:ABC-type dipeptide/oligopeptide/nickel transport system permease component
VLVLSGLYLAGNLCVDLLYSYLNPRIRHARG